ncbi:DASH complex subunit dad2 [Thecaphora frezii]
MSHRASILPSQAPRPSLYPGGGMAVGATTGAQARLAAKQAELDGLRSLRDHSERIVVQLQALGDKVDTLLDGGVAVAGAMEQWQGVFRAIQIARASMSTISPPLQYHNPGPPAEVDVQDQEDANPSDTEEHEAHRKNNVMLETIVRLPLELDPNSPVP